MTAGSAPPVDAASNLGLVYHVARRLARTVPAVAAMGLDEAVSAGMPGLVRAAQLFDPSRGFQFSSYAYRAIARGILRAAGRFEVFHGLPLDAAGALEVPDDATAAQEAETERLRDLADRLGSALEALPPREAFVVRSVSLEGRPVREVAREMGLTPSRVRQLRASALERLREAPPLAGLA